MRPFVRMNAADTLGILLSIEAFLRSYYSILVSTADSGLTMDPRETARDVAALSLKRQRLLDDLSALGSMADVRSSAKEVQGLVRVVRARTRRCMKALERKYSAEVRGLVGEPAPCNAFE